MTSKVNNVNCAIYRNLINTSTNIEAYINIGEDILEIEIDVSDSNAHQVNHY